MMGTFFQDLRYGVRILTKSPGFTTVVVLALSLGIGANTALFTVVNAILLRPLPLPRSEQLVSILERWPNGQGSASFPNLSDWREQNQVFQGIAFYLPDSFTLKGDEGPVRTAGDYVSANYFSVLGIRPAIGRTFVAGEDEGTRNRFVVLSDPLWRSEFGADASVVGRTISLNGAGFTIVGVMPSDFRFRPPYSEAQLWVPFVPDTAQRAERGMHFISALGRLKPGVTLQEAQTEMDTIASRLAQEYPATNKERGVAVLSLHEQIVREARTGLLILLAAVGLVLLTVCANVVTLLLARMSERRKEISIRMALGASRLRLVRQFLAESLILLLLSGAAAWLLALWGVHLLVLFQPGSLPLIEEITPDARVLGFTFIISLATALVLGLAPAFRDSTFNLQGGLREGTTGTRSHKRGFDLLVTGEVAIALVLMVAAALLIESFWRIRRVKPGFEAKHVLTMRIALPDSKYSAQHPASTFYDPALEKISSLPGVESAGLISILPIQDYGTNSGFNIEGHTPWPENGGPLAELRAVSAEYFHAMEIPYMAGRGFAAQDTKDAPLVCIINQTMAREFWPGENPVGRRIQVNPPDWMTIVGVVADSKQAGLDQRVLFEVDMPYMQIPWPVLAQTMSLVIRTSVEPTSLTRAIRDKILSVDQDQPVFNVRTMESVLEDSVGDRHFNMLLMGLFASLALILSALGTYGVLAYTIKLRRREIGIRIALGAQKPDVLKLVVGHGLVRILIGTGIGLVAAIGLIRLMSSLLFGIQPLHPLAFSVGSVVVIAAGLAASWIPARRATQVDPIEVLRSE